MNSDDQSPIEERIEAAKHQLHELRHEWRWFVLLGYVLILLGVIAIGAATYFFSVAVVVLFGVLLLAGGIAQIVSSFWTPRWDGFLLHLLIGVFYTVAGVLIVDAPEESTAAITLMIAAFLMVSGAFRIAAALSTRFHDWGWVLLNGVISLLLGVMIYRQWPGSGEWVIGLFVGIEMLFNGIFWVMLGNGLKRLAEEDDEA